MNELHHWYAEEMAKHEMQEVNRAVEQTRLLKEADLSGPGLLARAVYALRNLLGARRERVRDRHSLGHESYQSLKEC